MCRLALGLVLVSSMLLLAGCMSVESGPENQSPSPANQGCQGACGRVAPPPTLASLQDAYGRPYPIASPWSSNPPGNNWLAQQKLNQSIPIDPRYLQFYGNTAVANMNQPTDPSGLAQAGYTGPPIPVPRGGLIAPPGFAPFPSLAKPGAGPAQAGGFNAGAAGAMTPGSGGIQQAQYGYNPPANYPPANYPPSRGWPAQYPNQPYGPYQSYYYPYPGYSTYPAGPTGYAGPQNPGFNPIQKTQFSAGGSGVPYTPPGAPFNPAGARPFPAGAAGMGMGAPGGWCPPGQTGGANMRTQVRFVRPVGMKVHWYTMGPDCRPTYAEQLIVPGYYNFPQGAIYRLKLTNIDERPELDVYPTMEVMVGNSKTEAFLSHSAVPLVFTSEDFKQIVEGNYVVKVIYLPDPQFQDVAGTGLDEILSTRLEPGADPVQEARKRGTVLMVIRMGNVQQELDNTPPLNAPGRSAMGPQGCPPGQQFCPPGYAPGYGQQQPQYGQQQPQYGQQQPQYGSPSYGSGAFGPGFSVGGYGPGGPPTSLKRQLIQVPMESQYGFGGPQGSAGNANPQGCAPGVFPGHACPPNMGQGSCPPGYGMPGYCPPGYGTPGNSGVGHYPGPVLAPTTPATPAPAEPAPKTSQDNPPRTLASGATTSLPAPGSDMPATLPPPDVHETKSSPIGTGLDQQKPATSAASAAPSPKAAEPMGPPPSAEPSPEVPPVLPNTPAPSSLPEPPPGTSIPDPPVTVNGPNGVLKGPPPETGDTPSTPTPLPSDTAKPPMGTPASKAPETPATLPGTPSVPQTLPPTPGLNEVAPPPIKTPVGDLKGADGPAVPMAPTAAPPTPTSSDAAKPDATPAIPPAPAQPARTPMNQAMPAFPENAAPLQPAPVDLPKFPAGEPVGRPGTAPSEPAPATPPPIDVPKVPTVDAPPPSSIPAVKIEAAPPSPTPPPISIPAVKVEAAPSSPTPPPAPSASPAPSMIEPPALPASAPTLPAPLPALPPPATGEPPMALPPTPPASPTPTSEPPVALPAPPP